MVCSKHDDFQRISTHLTYSHVNVKQVLPDHLNWGVPLWWGQRNHTHTLEAAIASIDHGENSNVTVRFTIRHQSRCVYPLQVAPLSASVQVILSTERRNGKPNRGRAEHLKEPISAVSVRHRLSCMTSLRERLMQTFVPYAFGLLKHHLVTLQLWPRALRTTEVDGPLDAECQSVPSHTKKDESDVAWYNREKRLEMILRAIFYLCIYQTAHSGLDYTSWPFVL